MKEPGIARLFCFRSHQDATHGAAQPIDSRSDSILEDHMSVTPVVGVTFGREPAGQPYSRAMPAPTIVMHIENTY
ncbi:MAG: hypothetical protein ACYDC8_14035 [Gammaproteobacteria bacterium]